MRKLLFASLLLFSIISCKKESNDNETKNYNIEVRVDDKVSYTYKSNRVDKLVRQYNSTSLPNTSYKTTESYKISETGFVYISTSVSKEEYFEVTITNSSTGVVAAHKREKGELTILWSIRDN